MFLIVPVIVIFMSIELFFFCQNTAINTGISKTQGVTMCKTIFLRVATNYSFFRRDFSSVPGVHLGWSGTDGRDGKEVGEVVINEKTNRFRHGGSECVCEPSEWHRSKGCEREHVMIWWRYDTEARSHHVRHGELRNILFIRPLGPINTTGGYQWMRSSLA